MAESFANTFNPYFEQLKNLFNFRNEPSLPGYSYTANSLPENLSYFTAGNGDQILPDADGKYFNVNQGTPLDNLKGLGTLTAFDKFGNKLGTFEENSWFTNNFGTMKDLFGLGLGAVKIGTGLAGLAAYRDQVDALVSATNRNIANRAKMINNQYDASARIAASMEGSLSKNGSIGMTSQSVKNKYLSDASKRHVDGSPIA